MLISVYGEKHAIKEGNRKKIMPKQCSELFNDLFDSSCSGCIRTCACGITWFDTYNTWDWEKGELEELNEKEKANPDKYKSRDCSIGTLEINGIEIVYRCTCDLAYRYEQFIRIHAVQIAKYLNEMSKQLKERSEAIKVNYE